MNSIFFQKTSFCISLPILVIALFGCLHEFFFLSFVCFMSHMSEFDALLACRRSF